MNRDNALFALMGIVLGFVAAYPAYEAMSSRQPALRSPASEQAAGAPGAGAPRAGAPGAGSQGPAQGAAGPMQGQEEVQRLRRYVEDNPGDADAVLTLANLNFQIGSFGRAGELYEQYLGLRPDDPNVLTDLGVSYREQGELERSLAQFRRAREVAPGHWQALFNEVIVLALDLGDYAAAEGALEELKRLQPGNPDVERLVAAVEQRRASAS